MEDFLREKGVVQSSKIKLQDTSNGVHVVVILVPSQWVLTYIRRSRRSGVKKPDNNTLDKVIKVLPVG